MPFNNSGGFFPDLKNTAADPGDIPPVTANNGQLITDYSSASATTLQQEASNKLTQQGNASSFNYLSKDIQLVEANKVIVAKAAGTNQVLGVIGDAPRNEVPADTLLQAAPGKTDSYKVTLTADPTGDVVIFDAMPDIGESHQAQYDDVQPLQHPGSILKYKTTPSRDWSLSVRLISRTVEEASHNLRMINIIRSWVMPFYGQGTANDKSTTQYLGAPPPVLTFKAYGKSVIGPVKCVLTSYQWNWPNDIDYLQTNDVVPVPVPVIMSITLNLRETYSPREFSGFDLMAYRSGNLPTAFNAGNVQLTNGKDSTPSGLNPSAVDPSQLQTASSSARQSADSRANARLSSTATSNPSATAIVRTGAQAVSSMNNRQRPRGSR